MDTISLYRLALSDKEIANGFGGVFPSDMLPVKRGNYKSWIINMQKRNQPGNHWISLFFDTDNNCHYFDSYGFKPKIPSIIKFIRQNSKRLYYNKHVYQGPYSTACGYFCLYFLYRVNRNQSLWPLNARSKNFNEMYVIDFVHKKLYYADLPSNVLIFCNQCNRSLLNK